MLKFTITPNNILWNVDSRLVFMELRAQENFLKTCMVERGYLYENQIYESLGIPWNPNNENRKWLNNNTYPPVQLEMIKSCKKDYLVLVHLATEES